ncbi:alpha-L-fucosidase, partial [Gardnerella vaginalis]
ALSIQVLSPNTYEGNPKYLVDRKQGTALSSSKPIDFRMVFTEPTYIDGLVIEEDISKGQHVETAEIHVVDECGVNHHVSDVHAIGYRKILRFDAIRAVSLTVRITSIRQYVALQSCYPLVAQDE